MIERITKMRTIHWKEIGVCPECGKKLTTRRLDGTYCCTDCYKNNNIYKIMWDLT